jgi:hypothetical protein
MAPAAQKWHRIGGDGRITKWVTPGQSIEGEFRGLKDGKYGQLGTIKTADGKEVTFPIHSALEKLNNLRPGADVMIQYTGLEMSKQGREFKAFDVFVGNPDDYEKPEERDAIPF